MTWIGYTNTSPVDPEPGALETAQNTRLTVAGEARTRRGMARSSLAKATTAIYGISEFALSPTSPYAVVLGDGFINGDDGLDSLWGDDVLTSLSGTSSPDIGLGFTITIDRNQSPADAVLIYAKLGSAPTDTDQGTFVERVAMSAWLTQVSTTWTASSIGNWMFRAYPVKGSDVGPGVNLYPATYAAVPAVYFTSVETVGARAYLIGGIASGGVDAVDSFSTIVSATTTQPRPSLTEARGGTATAVIGGRIYVIGGTIQDASDPTKYRATNLSILPEAETSWTAETVYPEALAYLNATASASHIYVLGGFDGSAPVDRRAELRSWTPGAGAWTLEITWPFVLNSCGFVWMDGRIYQVGGLKFDSPTPSVCATDVRSWAPGEAATTVETSLPTGVAWNAAAAVNGRIYSIGGSTNITGTAMTSAVYSWAPGEVSWTSEPSLAAGLRSFGCSVLQGKIIIAGGYNGSSVVSDVYTFSPGDSAWRASL